MNENNWESMYENLCKRCFIKLAKPTKKEIKQIVLTEYDERCACCGKFTQVVDYVEGDY